MNSFGVTDKGKVRSENQDSYIVERCDKRKSVVAVICDGMGGAKAGDLASQLSSKAFVSRVFETLVSPRFFIGNQEKLLRESCDDANGVVYEYSRFDPNYNGMGTTLVGGIITKRNYQSLMDHVGSGRAWDLSRKNGGIYIIPPFNTAGAGLHSSRMEALAGAMDFLRHLRLFSEKNGCGFDFLAVFM